MKNLNYSPLMVLKSNNRDAVKIIKKYDKKFKLESITPDLLRRKDISSIGNGDLLIKYAERHPEDYTVILASFMTLKALDFIKLLKKIYKCIPSHDFGIDILDITSDFGYDYLSHLVNSEFKYCDSTNENEFLK